MSGLDFTRGFSASRGRGAALLWLLRAAAFAWLLVWACESLAAPAIPPAPRERVTDKVGVMSAEARESLERRLAAYEAAAQHQIIVWIDRTTGGQDIETFAAEAFEAWKIGRAKLDDGLAIFLMSEDQTVRIEVGYGLESVVTDLKAAELIRTKIIPPIQAGDWDTGVRQGVEGVVAVIEGHPDALPADPRADAGEGANQPTAPPDPPWLRIAKIVGAALLGLALLILFITHPRLAILALLFMARGGRGGGGGGFGGGGGRSGGGGATGRW